MKIFCRICNRSFESAATISSPKEGNGAASAADSPEQGKIFGLMAEHLKNKHRHEAGHLTVTLATCHALIAVYLLLEYVVIPPNEAALLEWTDKLEDELVGLLCLDGIDKATEAIHAAGDVPLN